MKIFGGLGRKLARAGKNQGASDANAGGQGPDDDNPHASAPKSARGLTTVQSESSIGKRGHEVTFRSM